MATATNKSVLAQALAAHGRGHFREAERLYEALLRIDEKNSVALTLLGTLNGQEGRLNEALALLSRSLALNPNQPVALNSAGNVLKLLNRCGEALAYYDKAIALKPDYVEAHGNRGTILQALKRHADALASYDKAIAFSPANAQAYCSRGRSLVELGRYAEALANYSKAIALKPDYADVYQNRLNAFRNLGNYELALADYERLIRLDPTRPYILGDHLSLKMDLCIWDRFAESCEAVRTAVEAGSKAAPPFEFLKIPSAPMPQRRCAEIYAMDKYPPSPEPLWRGERYAHGRIRVGYFSADLHNHATSYLIAELIEKHDRSRFEIFAFSFGPASDDAMRHRLAKSFDRFVDVDAMTDYAAANLARQLEIDIAVDLKGFTFDARPAIFAMRPAPIQVGYLGFPATMGAPYMDYLIADRVLIPPDRFSAYTEKIVHLPHCYQANDTKRKIAETVPSRREAGLPDEGFVFCGFHNNFKITPDIFDVWMRLLRASDGSVLWLLAANRTACDNLRREASARGIDPRRLVFAPKLTLPDHLARHRLADLFLDTFHCNAHTTASDALWAGLPVLTHPGETFASRVAASLLNAIGLPDLITGSPAEYESLALRFVQDRDALESVRERLARNRMTHPLFDIDLFTYHLETAYVTMWQRHQKGESPDHIAIAPTP